MCNRWSVPIITQNTKDIKSETRHNAKNEQNDFKCNDVVEDGGNKFSTVCECFI